MGSPDPFAPLPAGQRGGAVSPTPMALASVLVIALQGCTGAGCSAGEPLDTVNALASANRESSMPMSDGRAPAGSCFEVLEGTFAPPSRPLGRDIEWADVWRIFGTTLPSDYQQFIDTYGSVKIGDLAIYSARDSSGQAWMATLLDSIETDTEYETKRTGSPSRLALHPAFQPHAAVAR